jgi:hypothetical protein
VTIISAAPAAPTNLVATALSSSQIRLTWKDNATSEAGFKIERALTSGGPWTQIYSGTTSNLTSYTVTGLAANTRYYFRLRAYSGAGNSGYSSVVNARTKAAPVMYQAESATLAGGAALASNHSGYTGSGFVDFPANGGSVTWSNVSAAVAASHTLTFRYALGAGSARTVTLRVNGVTLSGGVRFAPTAGWRTWATVTVTVNLVAGANTIQLLSNGQDGGNVDSMTVTEI